MRALYRLPNGTNCIYFNSNKSTATKLFDGLVTYEMDEQKSLTTVLVEVLKVNYEIKDNRFIISLSVEATAYKIIEYFFDEEGLMLDNAVSRYISQFGPHFSVEKIKTLRWVRSRCIHPRAIHGHLSPEDINSVIYSSSTYW